MSTDFFHVTGSYGDLLVNAETGAVLEYLVEDDAYGPDDPEGQGYRDIVRFDVAEWRSTYSTEQLAGLWIDILDIGFWTDKNEHYEPPENDWRKEFRANRDNTKGLNGKGN
jgi:hypothetical protein